MSRIMLATNAGTDSRILHVVALRRAEEQGADLAVVHVIGGADFDAQPDQMQEAIKSETEWLIHTMLGLAADRSGVTSPEVAIHVLDGDVADVLVEFARTVQPELVMIGLPRTKDHSEFTTESFAELLGWFEEASIAVEQVQTA